MLECLNDQYIIFDRTRPSRAGVAALTKRYGRTAAGLVELYSEVGSFIALGRHPRIFRIDSPLDVIQNDIAYKVSSCLPGAIPIGSDCGGHAIVFHRGLVQSVGWGVLDESELTVLAPTLEGFFKNPEPLWPWIEDEPPTAETGSPTDLGVVLTLRAQFPRSARLYIGGQPPFRAASPCMVLRTPTEVPPEHRPWLRRSMSLDDLSSLCDRETDLQNLLERFNAQF